MGLLDIPKYYYKYVYFSNMLHIHQYMICIAAFVAIPKYTMLSPTNYQNIPNIVIFYCRDSDNSIKDSSDNFPGERTT